jgi:primosomal protein N' (replication factor Y)
MVSYPPHSALAKVEFRHADRLRADALGREAASRLREAASPAVRILGPVDPPIARLEGKHRVHILLKAPARHLLHAALSQLLDGPMGRHAGRTMLVEMDPHNLM